MPRLQDQLLEDYTYEQMIGNRFPAPAISSLRNNPSYALSTLYVRKARREGVSCDSPDAGDFEFERLFKHQLAGCEVDSRPGIDALTLKKVTGQAALSFQHVVGGINSSADHAYEFSISDPVIAAEKDPAKCANIVEIMRQRLPARTCEVRYITGVVLTQITSRELKEVKVEGQAAQSVVQIGGKFFGATTNIVNKFDMTVDALPVTQYFAPTPTFGYLANLPVLPDGGVRASRWRGRTPRGPMASPEAMATSPAGEGAPDEQPPLEDLPTLTELRDAQRDGGLHDAHSLAIHKALSVSEAPVRDDAGSL
ncbi:hypothetical protein [Pyxidicoccus trucidator]|uniref:hypothetical protein n=1 Tax=Pyxidicoccus trucidator TaxID=2709662 RepID=UPI001967AB38|nr:hypothetical protein [Pyxidicoccus trucidator]